MARAVFFARVDDRLIHGQVIVGCCGPLDAHRILLVDDDMADDAFQQRIYSAAVPPEIEVEYLEVETAVRRLSELRALRAPTTIVLTRDCDTMRRLVLRSEELDRVCVGGMHFREGADEIWPGFYLDAADRDALRDMLRRGVEVVVQSVPGSEAVDAAPALDPGEEQP